MSKNLTLKQFIEKAKEVHGNKYDYSKVDYKTTHEKICIICPEHGEFWQSPSAHLRKQGCPKCANSVKISKEDFIEKAKQVHGDKYDYSKVNYINNRTKICIICPEHGEFWQNPYKHLVHNGCQKCSNRFRRTTEDFIKDASIIHNNKYDYSKVNYKNTKTDVCIICPTHGEFWQRPEKHLYAKHGCPFCNVSKLETEIRTILTDNNIEFEEQKRFDWLGKQSIDFYIPSKNIAIECQGIQHFQPVDFGGKGKDYANEKFEYIKECDNVKKQLLKKNNIKLIYYSNLTIEYPYKVYTNINDIIKLVSDA